MALARNDPRGKMSITSNPTGGGIKFAPGPIQNQRLPSPEETKRSLLATELMREMAGSVEPIYSPVHGIAKLGMGALSGYMGARAERRADEADRGFSADLAKTLGGFGGGSGGGSPAGASPLSFGGPSTPAGPSASSPAGGARAAAGGPSSMASALPASFLASVDGTEGGGDYDTLFGHSQRDGGLFAGTRISQMPISQVLAFADPSGQYGQWVKGQVGRVATPMGRHQIVGSTLRRAVADLGIDPSTPFDQGTQDMIAAHLARGRLSGQNTMGGKISALRSEWEGFKHVPDAQMAQIVSDLESGAGGPSVPQRAPEPGPVQVASLDPSIGMPAPRVSQDNAALAEAVNPAGAPQAGPQQLELAAAVMSYDPSSVPQAPAQDPRMIAQMVADPSAGMSDYMNRQRELLIELLNSDNPQTRAAGQAMAGEFMGDYRDHQQAMQTRAYDEQQAQITRQNGIADYRTKAEIDREFAQPTARRTFQGPDGNHYYEDGSLVLPGVAKPEESFRPATVEEAGVYGERSGQIGPDGRFYPTGDKGPSVVVNNGANGSKFTEKSEEAAAGRLNDIVTSGNSASQFLGDMQQLAALGTQIETGLGAQALVKLGPIAQAVGIEIEGLAPAQAYESIISRLAPQMRPAGSGAASDFDARQFLNALPTLGNSPAGNQIINQTFQALQQNKIDAAEIASRAYIPVEQGGITWQEAEAQIRALPNPYERYKEARDRPDERGGAAVPAVPPSASSASQAPEAQPSGAMPMVVNDEQFDALPSGALFVGADGKTRRKP